METFASINWEDGHIRLYPESRLEPEIYKAVKENGFIWKRNQEAFTAPYSPWRMAFLQKQFGIQELEDDETDLAALAEERAERYDGYSENAGKRRDEARKKVNSIMDHIPAGQPILIGHHSEKRHRRDLDKVDQSMRKSIEEDKKSGYWKGRAESALSRMERKEKPGAIYRRIEKLEADARSMAARTEHSEATRAAWAWFYENRLAYERALYEASGGIKAESLTFEVGGGLLYRGWSWYEIKRINKKTVTIKGWLGSDNMEYKLRLDEIKGSMSKAEWEAADKIRTGTGWQLARKEGEE